MSIKVKLSKPIIVGTDEYQELELKKPTVDDLVNLNYPYQVEVINGNTTMKFQPGVILQYISKLSGIPPSAVKSVSLTDFSNLQAAVISFFGEEAETSQSS